MTRFLRFEVGGASCLLWMLVFLSPYLNIAALIQVDAMKLFAVVFGSITLSIPLGNYIHQFADSAFNPFARQRLLIFPRAVIAYLDRELGSSPGFHDNLYQVILVFAKSYERILKFSPKNESSQAGKIAQESTTELKVDTLREEIANRYSYFYARIENGAVAPIIGILLAVLVLAVFRETQYINSDPAFSPWWLLLVWMAAAISLLWRIPQLFRELDDLEIALSIRVMKDIVKPVTVRLQNIVGYAISYEDFI